MSTPGSKTTAHGIIKNPSGDQLDPRKRQDVGESAEVEALLATSQASDECGPHESGPRKILQYPEERSSLDDRVKTSPGGSNQVLLDDGFAARHSKTSLHEWLSLIELGHRDAEITVLTDDGREGRLWCVGGEIVDAECGTLTGVVAADRILSFKGGDFSVSFGSVERPRVISATTAASLRAVAQRNGTTLAALGQTLIQGSPSTPPPHRKEARLSSIPAPLLRSDMPVAHTQPPEPPLQPRHRATPYAAGAMVGAAIALTLWSRSGPKSEVAAASDNQPVTMEPIAEGRISDTPVNLGDKLPTAPTPRVVILDDLPPAKTSIVERPRRVQRESPRPRRASTQSWLDRPGGDDLIALRRDTSKPKAQWADSLKPKIDIVDASKPRIQIIEPMKPKVQIIDPATPKVQIIEPAKPKIQNVDPSQPKVTN
jgi:hypothetical protein